MTAASVALFALVVVGYVSQSQRLGRAHLTAPIVFAAAGTALGLTVLSAPSEPATLRALTEVTLALVLFHDAAQVQPRQLRLDAGLCARLLLVGLPLTIALGYLAAWLLLPTSAVWPALLLAAALAPTDAGLGAATVLNPVVPTRVRRLLNVESGLNDGLSTPVVLLAVTLATAAPTSVGGEVRLALRELAVGVLVGAALAAAAGLLLSLSIRRGWVQRGLLPVATLAVPLMCYYGARMLQGNGFVAAFVAGVAFAAAADWRRIAAAATLREAEHPLEMVEQGSVFLGYGVWALFGTLAVARLGELFTWQGLVFAVLSLTVLRMVPVALVLLGTGLRRPTLAFVGWFGPRGLASVVFALLAVESLPMDANLSPVIGAIATTVLLSVVLHGITADPWARRYGAWAGREQPVVEMSASVEPSSGRGIGWRHLHPDHQPRADRR